MKTATVELTYQQAASICALFHIVDGQPDLTQAQKMVRYDPARKEVTACSSHVFRREPIELDYDGEILFESYGFRAWFARRKKELPSWRTMPDMRLEHVIEWPDVKYPDAYAIVPPASKRRLNGNAPAFALDLRIVNDVRKSITWPGGEPGSVLFVASNRDGSGPVLMYRNAGQRGKRPEWLGLIMPCRSLDAVDALREEPRP